MSIKLVLFDFDGTLADTLPLSFRAFQAVFQKYDHREVTEKELVAMFGPTEDGILAANLRDKRAVQQAISDYYQLYDDGHSDSGVNRQEITDMLRRMKQRGIKIAVITGKSRRSYEISAKALQLSEFFDLTITGDDVEQPKPDPEGILKALQVLGVHKEEAVFLGDSNADIRAGQAAGLPTYAVQWLPTVQNTTFETTPDLILYDTQSFLDLLFH